MILYGASGHGKVIIEILEANGVKVDYVVDDNPEITYYALLRMKILFTTYGLLGIMDVATGILRGMERSLFPAIITIMGACVFRIWWVKAVWADYHTMSSLLWSYPVSWVLISIICITYICIVFRKMGAAQKYVSFRRTTR